MISVTIGIPASGKSLSKKRMVAREARRRKILWLTQLRAECNRVFNDLVKMGLNPEDITIVPSKFMICPFLRNLDSKLYHTLIGLAVCMVCRNDSCLFKQIIRKIRSADKGVFIATHKFLWLMIFFDTVVIDEYDYLIPHFVEIIPAKKIDALLRAISKIMGPDVAEKVKKRYLVKIDDDKYAFKTLFPLSRFYTRGELHIVSATLPNPRDDLFAIALGFSDMNELAEAELDGGIDYSVYTLPTPRRRDVFYIDEKTRYWTSPLTKHGHIYVIRRIREDYRRGDTITIITRSHREARMLHSMLRRKGIESLTEGVNWFKSNFDEWRRHQIRILVIRGMFYRSLDIESDKIYAFYQHIHPEVRKEIEKIWRIFFDTHTDELIRYDEYRVHVQTIFRCARVWSNKHEFYLLDRKYKDALYYFDHIYEYVSDKIHTVDF